MFFRYIHTLLHVLHTLGNHVYISVKPLVAVLQYHELQQCVIIGITHFPILLLFNKLKLLFFRIEKVAYIRILKRASLKNSTWDLLYYTQHVYNPSKNHACSRLVDYPTYHKLLFDTFVNNKLPYGMPSVVAFNYQLAT